VTQALVRETIRQIQWFSDLELCSALKAIGKLLIPLSENQIKTICGEMRGERGTDVYKFVLLFGCNLCVRVSHFFLSAHLSLEWLYILISFFVR
jgi:hypothetical protein